MFLLKKNVKSFFPCTHFAIKFVHLMVPSTVVEIAQPTITCSKLAIETLEQGVKYVHNKDTRTATLASICVFIVNREHISLLVLVFLLLTLSS